MPILSHTTLLDLHKCIVDAGLSDDWPALLAGIDRGLVKSFPRAASLAAQVLADLSELNMLELSPDETTNIPLEIVLRNAARLASGRAEERFFSAAAAGIHAAADSQSHPSLPMHIPLKDAFITTSATVHLFVTSDLWDVLVPLHCSADEPAGIVLDRLLQALSLPKLLQHEGRIGLRLKYSLAHSKRTLRASLPLPTQGAKNGDVLSLITRVTIFSATGAQTGEGLPFKATKDMSIDMQAGILLRSLFVRSGLNTGTEHQRE